MGASFSPGGGQSGSIPLVVSAKSQASLRAQVDRVRALVSGGVDVSDVGFSLLERSRFEHRAVLVGDEVVEGVAVEAGPGPVFVFPGQGSQWPGMAVELLGQDETFARWMAEADRAIEAQVGWSVIDVLRGEAELLERIEILQPALFAIMVSLAQTWRANGVEPAAVVGHSQGEIAAAYIAGALSLEEAAKIVVKRSQLFADELVGNGAVASIALPAEEVQKLLPGELAIAGINSPHACTVAGAIPELEKFVESCVAKDIRARVIGSTVASHCAQVDRLRDRIMELFADITPQTSSVPFYSTVTAERIDTATLDAEYWFQNARQPVSFAKVVEKLVEDGHRVLIESSAHPVLMLPAQQTAEAANVEIVAIGSLRRDQGDRFTTSLAEAWVAGLPVDWRISGRRIALPTYPFDHQRFWPEPLVKDTSDPVDTEFWQLIDNGELVDSDTAQTLAQWRIRRKLESTMDTWRYRDQWSPVTITGTPTGTWLVVTSGTNADDVINALPNAVHIDVDEQVSRADLAGLLPATFDGVIAMTGLRTTITLVQALAEAGVTAPIWAVTRGRGRRRGGRPGADRDLGTRPRRRARPAPPMGRSDRPAPNARCPGRTTVRRRVDRRRGPDLDQGKRRLRPSPRPRERPPQPRVPSLRHRPDHRWHRCARRPRRPLAGRGRRRTPRAHQPSRHRRTRCDGTQGRARELGPARHDRRLRRRGPRTTRKPARGHRRPHDGRARGGNRHGRRTDRRTAVRERHRAARHEDHRGAASARTGPARAVHPVLVGCGELGQRRPACLRRGQRLPRRPRAPAPIPGTSGDLDRVGRVGRRRNGR